MIGGELGVSNVKKIELYDFDKKYDYSLYDECSELHFTTDEGVRLILVFDKNITELLQKALDNSKRI